MKKDTSWNNVSTWYDKLVGEAGSDYHQNVIVPNAAKMLNPKKGEVVLDIACGQGVFSRKLASYGADVTGIDSSPELVKLAQSRSKTSHNIKYSVANAKNLKMFEDRNFDAVSCILAIQNMDPLSQIIREIGRVLKIKGRLLIVMSHPCFRIPRLSGWGFDEKRKLQYRRIDSYLSEKNIPIQMHPGAAPDVNTWTFHRPLSTYFKEFGKNNLAVVSLDEWITHRRTNEKADNKSREEIPLFMAILAQKLS